jgi:restriction endonuclease-like protein
VAVNLADHNQPLGASGDAVDWSGSLRSELRTRAEAWATKQGLPYYLSGKSGKDGTVLFEPTSDNSLHGNFHPAVWAAIREREEWVSRLQKSHPRPEALPQEKRASAKELDSSNSSDALLMNCFCFPGGVAQILARLSIDVSQSVPLFGFAAQLPLDDGTSDRTEIDMKIGGVIVEAKLTEADFTSKPEADVRRYRFLERCFEVAALPRVSVSDNIRGYQLVRNVLAAAEHVAQLIVLIDQRRPDLLEEWWQVHAAIKEVDLRLRCGFRSWQEVAAALRRNWRSSSERSTGCEATLQRNGRHGRETPEVARMIHGLRESPRSS